MLKHSAVWRAIDELAARNCLTPSGLARKAGLDPTTFNKSKRFNTDGRGRWPSTQSLAKALEAVGASTQDLFALLDAERSGRKVGRMLVAAESDVSAPSAFDPAGEPCGPSWNHTKLPNVDEPSAYAIKIQSDSYRPGLRPGGIVIAVPDQPVSEGDRVLIRTQEGEIRLAILLERTDDEITIGSLCGEVSQSVLPANDVAAVDRIVWVTL